MRIETPKQLASKLIEQDRYETRSNEKKAGKMGTRRLATVYNLCAERGIKDAARLRKRNTTTIFGGA